MMSPNPQASVEVLQGETRVGISRDTDKGFAESDVRRNQ
jgi:hypothetical protein